MDNNEQQRQVMSMDEQELAERERRVLYSSFDGVGRDDRLAIRVPRCWRDAAAVRAGREASARADAWAHAPAGTAYGDVESWEAINQERGTLIDQSIRGELSAEGRARLNSLQAYAERHVFDVAPRPHHDIEAHEDVEKCQGSGGS